MIVGTDVGVPITQRPSLALVSQMLEQFIYFLAHSREDIPSGISARCLGVLDWCNTHFLESRNGDSRRIHLARIRVNKTLSENRQIEQDVSAG